MSTLTMNPSTVRTQTGEIFSKKTPFNLFLMFTKVVDLKESPKRKIPFLLSVDQLIWISDKLKPLATQDANAFAKELATNGSAYEIGLTIPSEKYPNESWILYKKGEQVQARTLATISAEDASNAATVAAVK